MPVDAAHCELMQRVRSGEATPAEAEAFRARHRQRSLDILEAPAERLFTVMPVEGRLPEKARIEPSEPCAACGEAAMLSRLENVGGRLLCRACKEKQSGA